MSLPLQVYPGNYTPGALTSLHAAVDVINESWAQANSKAEAYEAKIDAITDEATGWLSTTAAPHITGGAVAPPTVLEPSVDIPANVDTNDVMALFDTKYLELVALLSDKFILFRSTYFPDESTTYAAAEAWLQGALNNPNGGLPTAVAAQIIEDSRSVIMADAVRASDAVLQTFAARRFPLPPGAAASAVCRKVRRCMGRIRECDLMGLRSCGSRSW